MCLYVLLQILGPLEGLSAEVALVRLEWHMNANVGGNVVALDGGGAAGSPLASQVEVVGALATDMAFADVVLQSGQRCLVGASQSRNLHRVLRHSRIAHRSLATGR